MSSFKKPIIWGIISGLILSLLLKWIEWDGSLVQAILTVFIIMALSLFFRQLINYYVFSLTAVHVLNIYILFFNENQILIFGNKHLLLIICLTSVITGIISCFLISRAYKKGEITINNVDERIITWLTLNIFVGIGFTFMPYAGVNIEPLNLVVRINIGIAYATILSLGSLPIFFIPREK